MTAVILTIHTMLVLALVGVVLLQRSEGGALGIGGGGGFMSGRGAANVLTRTTTILGAAFFVTSMVLALMSDRGTSEADIARTLTGEETPAEGDTPAEVTGEDILDVLGSGTTTPPAAETAPTAPLNTVPAEAAPDAAAPADPAANAADGETPAPTTTP